MSDEFDNEVEDLTARVVLIYRVIAAAALKLPIPIRLPGGPVYDSREIMPAVVRATELIEDQPLNDDAASAFWGACLSWLTAARLLGQWQREPWTTGRMEILLSLTTTVSCLHDHSEAMGLTPEDDLE